MLSKDTFSFSTLFNIYAENVSTIALNNSEGIHVGEEAMSNIPYADDTAILAESQEELQSMLNRVQTKAWVEVSLSTNQK